MSRNDNANYGIGRIGGFGNVGLYTESETAKYGLGEKLELADGRIFRYCNFDAAVTVGKMVGADQSTGAADEISDGVISGGGAGSTAVTLTASGSAGPPADFQGVSANDYAGSYLHTTDGDGEGFTYRIKSNGAASSDAVEFTLYDPIVTALATGASDWAISASRYNNCHITDATQGTIVDPFPTGVTMRGITSGYFAWVQTRGQATCLADGTITEGNRLTLSDGVNGAVHLKDAETEVEVGHALTTVATGEYAPIMLSLE